MPVQICAPKDRDNFEAVMFVAKHEYLSTLIRLGPLCFGALAALIALEPSYMQTIFRWEQLCRDMQ